MKKHQLILLFASLALVFQACQQPIEVDLLVHNATIYTMDEQLPQGEAMVIDSGVIVAVGSEHEIMNRYAGREVIDAQKQFIYPGFNDAHSHFLGYGTTKMYSVDLVGTSSMEEVIERLKAHMEQDTSVWITGRGWDQTKWDTPVFPTSAMLDSLFPDRYIVLKRLDGHALLASSNVLKLAGIDAETTVPGGKILLEGTEPTGILIDEAMNIAEAYIPPHSKSQKSAALQRAAEDCWAMGLTSVTDAGLSTADIRLIHQLQNDGQLSMRVYAMFAASDTIIKRLSSLSMNSDWLRTNSVKIYADGALGSRGALLSDPYSDDTLNHGLLITPLDSLEQWARACHEAEFQLCVHSIGDSSARKVLQIMGDVLGGTNDRRWRIEHAQVVSEQDRELFGAFNVLPSMQPTHATSDMGWAEKRLGAQRIDWAYALESLKKQNGMIALGTDFPVEAINPLATFYAAVERKNTAGEPADGFLSDQALSRKDALMGMTLWPAIASFEENKKGSLTEGKFADFIILDTDLLTCEPEQILNTKVIATRINGIEVYAQ